MVRSPILALAILAGASLAPPVQAPAAEGLRVIDGDTISVTFPPRRGEPKAERVSIRLAGIDTPEKGHRARCAAERELALLASAALATRVGRAAEVLILRTACDHYGREVGRLILDGQDVAPGMVALGIARPLAAGERRQGWCE